MGRKRKPRTTPPKDASGPRPLFPKRLYRLRIVGERDPNGNYPLSRDVYIESAVYSKAGGYSTAREWKVSLCSFSLPVDEVRDLILWALRDDGRFPRDVLYEPDGNMAGHINPAANRNDQPYLFDPG